MGCCESGDEGSSSRRRRRLEEYRPLPREWSQQHYRNTNNYEHLDWGSTTTTTAAATATHSSKITRGHDLPVPGGEGGGGGALDPFANKHNY